MCGITGVAGSLRSRARDAAAHERSAAPPRTGRRGSVLERRGRARHASSGDHRPEHGRPADLQRGSHGLRRLQRRDLQLPRASRASSRAAGIASRRTPDTEVVVHAYEEFGPDCVERLWGMFALALWDSRQHLLLLARDRLGKKPLVYYADPTADGVALPRSCRRSSPTRSVPREVEPSAIDDYLTYLYVPAPTHRVPRRAQAAAGPSSDLAGRSPHASSRTGACVSAQSARSSEPEAVARVRHAAARCRSPPDDRRRAAGRLS